MPDQYLSMPEICRFYGIVINIYYNDHGPAHFHARYGGNQAVFSIEGLTMLQGRLPPRAHGLVVEWARFGKKNSGQHGLLPEEAIP